MDTATRRNRLRRAILETLERRELMAYKVLEGIFAPNTTAEYREAWTAKANAARGASGGGPTGVTGPVDPLNDSGFRWSNPTGGASPFAGDPARVSWSIVPDGTIDAGDANQTSNLVAFMDSIYGGGTGPVSQRPWFNIFQRAYDRWSQETGLTFVYEPNDDGLPFGGIANRGVTGTRGDIRIGGHRIDGDSGILAYNYYPAGSGNSGRDGDMVIDTADRFYRDFANGPSGENRGLLNVLMHEVGHGIGLGHVIPVNNTKLMEPNLTFAFLGTQHDDIMGGLLLYGDDKERNNTTSSATNLGDLGNGTTVTTNVAVNGIGDQDWFKLKVPAAGRITLNVAPTGQQYIVSVDTGTPAAVDTLRNGDLALQLTAADGTVLASVNNTALGGIEAINNLQLPSGGEYFVRVTGTGTQPQLYNLTVTLSGIVTNPAAVRGPRLLSVAPNSGEIFSFNSVNSLKVSPTELVFRFDGASDIDAATLAKGIRITRAGKDGVFGPVNNVVNDVKIVPGYVGFGDNDRIVILRFATPLPDDLYRIEVMGQDVPAEDLLSIKNVGGDKLIPRTVGTDRDVVNFQLELGAQIVAVVPQPVTRNAAGLNIQARNKIEVYFNDDDLFANAVKTGDMTPNPSVVDPNFYQLFADRGTVTNTDDTIYRPASVEYFPSTNLAVLTFASNIDELSPTKDTSFRLRIGTNEVVPTAPLIVTPAEPLSTFSGANNVLGTFNTLSSFEINQGIFNSTIFPLDFPGAPDMPGTREINPERKFSSDNPDSGVDVALQFYNFNTTVPYGRNSLGQEVFSSITEQQKARAREIFEFYGSMLGIKFVETADFTNNSWTIVTGDLGVFGSTGGQGGTLAVAGSVPSVPGINYTTFGRRTVVMDASENWNDEFGSSDNTNKPSWFVVATHEIGHLMGLGHASELPPGTNMGGQYSNATNGGIFNYLANSPNPVEPVFPGAAEQVNGKYLYRPDSRDIDMYRFTVASGKPGVFSAEIVAERNGDSSLLDSFLTLYRELPNGQREVVAVNDNYFSKDSFLQLQLQPGVYYVGVSASGNSSYNPEIQDSGLNGVSEGSYKLRVSFRPLASSSDPLLPQPIVDAGGSALDGDSDGIAGGVFHYWFNAAAPNGSTTGQRRALFVDKTPATDPGQPLGSLANPYSTIQAAFAASVPGDIVRVLPNGGLDGLISTAPDNVGYEIGRGGLGNNVLADGETMDVPRGVTVMVDAGVLFKVGATSIGVGSSTSSTDRSQANLQVLGTPDKSVLFTSYNDETLGVDTSSLVTTPRAGDWGGLIFRNAIDRSEGRFDSELHGRFVNHVSYADMRYGGGRVNVDGQQTVINPLHMVSARPTIINNRITLSADAAMSADPDSFEETNFTTSRYQSDVAFTPDYNRVGPEIHGNTAIGNSVNGLFVKVDTLPGQPAKTMTVAGRFDDTDIVHVVSDVLTIKSTPGGPFRESIGPSLSVVNMSATNVIGGALTAGTYQYRMTFVDANGNESVASESTLPFVLTAGNNAIRFDSLPSAGAGFVARRLYRSFNGGAFLLAAEIDRSTQFYVDSLATRATVLSNATQLNRARLDASLVIDPGTIIKLAGGQFVTGIGAQLVAEGSADLPIIFTSRKDDRFGAGGTFDTNNDRGVTSPVSGDWGGIYFGQTGQGSIDHARITFGGGVISVGGTFAGFNAIEIHQADVRVANTVVERNEQGTGGQAGVNRVGYGFNEAASIFVRGSEPIIVNNVIQNNAGAAVSINAAAMSGNAVRDFGRSRGVADRLANITENKGPLFRGNAIGGNGSNGLVIRGETITSESVWDDTDLVHVVYDEIVVPDLYIFGGLRLLSSPTESLVVKLGPNAGFTSTGRPLDIDDRIGGTIQVVGTPGFPVVLTSIKDDTIGAGFNPAGGAQVDVTSDGTSTLPARGDWRSVRLDRFTNDRNVDITTELEPAQSTGAGVNGTPGVSQSIGEIAANEKSGDDRLRLGMTVLGTINNPDDVDVYAFAGTAGTQVWIDIDRTDVSLDTVVELIDSNGTIIAQSDNSFDESRGLLSLYRNGALISANQVNSMQQDLYAPRNRGNGLGQTFGDFYSTNPLDAGMRLVLPGATGTKNNYFVRVRSSNIDSADPAANRADLQDASKLSRGKTEGQYQLQVRLREMDEIAGATVRYSDIRYATTGIEILGMPGHSPLLGEGVEPIGINNDAIANALNLGNFGNTDRAALSIAGELTNANDVDWYRFDINQDVIQDPGLEQHLSAVIDVDYADGLSRPNTSLWLFYQPPQGGAIQLAYFGTDSNIADDLGAPLKGTNVNDLSRGSAGLLDAFLGTQELPSGTYYLALTSNRLISSYLDQFERRDAGGNPLVRAEPIDSVQRIAEDRFTETATTTAKGALQVAFSGTSNQSAFTLGDVPLFVLSAGGTELQSISTMTGNVTGTLARFTGNPMQDLAMRSDGNLYGAHLPNGAQTDATTGGIFTIDEATGTIANVGASGIQTFEIDPATNPRAQAQALNSNGTRAGDGMNFYGLTYPQTGGIGELFLYGVGSRGDTNPASFLSLAGFNDARNYVYKLNPSTFAATSAPSGDRQNLGLVNGAGTQIVERGYINTSVDTVQNLSAQAISMSDASPIAAPSLLSGDKIVLQTPAGSTTFEWVSSVFSASLIANTPPQSTTFPVAPTTYFKDGMSFQLTAGANTRLFEIDTGRVLNNRFGTPSTGTYDGSTFTITSVGGVTQTFEFDSNNAVAPANVLVSITGATRASLTQTIIAAINNFVPAANWNVRAAALPGTDRISLYGTIDTSGNPVPNTGDQAVALSAVTTALRNPLVIDQAFLNTFDPASLPPGQSYDGATLSLVDTNLNTITFELDSNNSVTLGNSRIPFSNTLTRSQLTDAIVTAINNPDPSVEAALPGGNFVVTAARQGTTNMINIANYEGLAVISANTATQINPLRIAGEYGTSLPGANSIRVEEYFTNLFNSQVAPTPSTPGAMNRLIEVINASAMGINSSSSGTRLILTGATAGDFREITTMLGGSGATPGAVPLNFNANDTAATLNARLLNAVRLVEPGAILMNDQFIWVPGTSSFDQPGTNDRLDVPPRNARLSSPNYGFVTGLTMIGSNQMYAVSENGDLYRVGSTFNRDSSLNNGDFIETIYNPNTRNRVNFAGISAGPVNAENGTLSNILFGIDTSGVLYAFDTTGRPAFVFDDAQWFIQTGVSNPTGLAFSNLDVNLWHETGRRSADAGHGVEVAPDGSRVTRTDGGRSLYFGFEDPTAANRQVGNWTGVRDPLAVPNSAFPTGYNSYDMAGGASGRIVSNTIDLSGYSPGDKPILYFNYFLDTENANANVPTDTNYMRDSFRVFVNGDDGVWKLLGTNNSDFDADRSNANDEFDYISRGDNAAYQVNELYDANKTFGGQTAPLAWRQARMDLSPFAGNKLVRVRFDFDTAANTQTGTSAVGGIELQAVPGAMIPENNKTFSIRNLNTGVTTTYEFDFGLLLNIPSGGRLAAGQQFTVDGVTYTFSTTNNASTNVFFAAGESGETIAARIVSKLAGQGLSPLIDPTVPSRISIINATSALVNPSATLPANFVGDLPGAAGGNKRVPVHKAMTYAQVRDAIRVAMAESWNPASQGSNTSTIRFHDRSIFLWNKDVISQGPLGLNETMPGDNFGVPNSINLGGPAVQRNLANNFEGVYIDDIVIGFAERGEMITGAVAGTTFSNNPKHEPDASIRETEEGTYQVEVRRSASYGLNAAPFPALTLVSGRTFDTNDRLAQGVSLVAPTGSALSDGQVFTLSDGVDTVTFEFNDATIVSGVNAGVAQGRVPVAFRSTDDADTVARSIRDAINSPAAQAVLNITAGMSDGTVTGSNFIYSGLNTPSTSRVINLHGLAAVNNQAGSAFSGTRLFTATSQSIINTNTEATSLGYILHGFDNYAQDDLGDSNRLRDQGQLVILGNVIRDTSNYGIVVDAGSRPGGVLTPLAGDLPHPGSAANLFQYNQERLAPGATITNNMIYGSATGGILFSGDTRTGSTSDGAVPFGRIINNTIVGLSGAGIGINVTENASPTLLNNIVASLATGVRVDGSSMTTVLGGMVYQNNANNTGGSLLSVGDFPQVLAPGQPLFVDNNRRNYYLANGSLAIDSSVDSLADRPNMTTVRQPLGIADSPIVAPDTDVTGQLRVDDPLVNTPVGLGGNVFKDRGAIDRSDFDGVKAVIQQPIDNDPDIVDVDRNETYLRLVSGSLEYFSVLLLETKGTGPDASTVTPETVALTENGRLLQPGVDYVFGYSVNSRTIRLTPLAGIWRSDSVYEITLQNSNGTRLTMSAGSAFKDGDSVVVTLAGGVTRTFEFDSSPAGVVNGSIAVPFSSTNTPFQLAAQLVAKMNAAGAGLSAYLEGDGSLMVKGAASVTLTTTSTKPPLTIANVRAIRDIAGNALVPNRANSLTQFTIVMPDVRLDYGDMANGANVLQASNGARHGLLPIDVPLLQLGQFADSDADGAPTTSVKGDDNDSLVELLTLASVGVVQGPAGPATLTMPAGSTLNLDGQQVIITDPMLKSITVEFNTDAAPSVASVVSVNVNTADTPAQVAAKFATAVNAAVLAGRVAGIAVVANGSTVTLGGTAQHRFNVAGAPAVIRQLTSNVELVMPTIINGSFEGKTFRITDGSGNVVTFEINDIALPAGVPPVAIGNVRVDIDLSSATPASLAQAIATAINAQRDLKRLTLGLTSVIGSSITIRANDEDGVTFGGIFNRNSNPVSITVVSTGAGMLDAWIDWNGDGDFVDVDEQLNLAGTTINGGSQPVQAGANVFNIKTPAGAKNGFTTARFRLSELGGLLPNGLAVGGEVEDYLIEIVDGTPPVAVPDSYAVDEDNVLSIAAPGVLANDTDNENDPRTVFDPDPTTPVVEPIVAPINGSLALLRDGSFVYTPNLDFFGTDTFAYYVTDPRLISNAPTTVTITVNPINDAPLANDDTITILEDEVAVRPGSLFWANDWRHRRNNPNENDQVLTLINAQIISPTGGTVSVANDTLTYTPPAHYNNAIAGPAKIVLTIRDSGAAGGDANPLTSTSTLTVNITPVNDRPEITVPLTTSTTEDAGPVTVNGFVTGIRPGPVEAFDEGTGPALQTENQQVSFQVRALAPTLFKTQPAINSLGVLTYEFAPDVNRILAGGTSPGFPSILVEVIAKDTGAGIAPDVNVSLPVTFTILPTEINDAPEFTLPSSTTSLEDAGLVTVPGFATGIRPGPSTALDEANQTLNVVITANPAAFTQAPMLDLVTGNLTYITAPHINSFTGQSLVVTVAISDSGSGVAPNANSTTKSFTINVTPVNDAPEFTMPATTSSSEDAGIVTVPAFISGIRPGPVAAVDEGTVRENQQVAFSVRAIDPTLFATQPAIDSAGQLVYQLAADVNRRNPAFPQILVEVIAVDTGASTAPDVNKSAPVTFTILPTEINDAPEFTIPASFTATEDAGLVTVPGFMTGIRRGPVTALDEVGQVLTVSLAGDASAFATMPAIDLATGTLTFQTGPDVNSFTGQSLVVTVTLDDDGSNVAPNVDSTTKTFTLTINPVNDVPAFSLPSTTTSVFEDNEEVVGTAKTQIPNFATGVAAGPATALDETTIAATRQTLNFVTVSVSNPTLFNGAPSLTPAGTLEFDTATDQNGSAVVVVRLVDSGSGVSPDVNTSADQTFTIVVRPVNDAPEFTLPATTSGGEDQGRVTVPGFASNLRPGPVTAVDEAGQTFTVTVSALDPAAFAVQPTIAADGTLIYRTATDINSSSPGRDLRVAVTLTDNGTSGPLPDTNVSVTKTFTVLTTPVNDAPQFTLPNSSVTVIEDVEGFQGTVSTTVSGFATNVAPGPFTATDEATQSVAFDIINVSAPELFSVQPTLTPSGDLNFKTAAHKNGKAVVIVRLVDSGPFNAPNDNDSERQTFTISVTPINDAPLFDIPTGLTVNEDDGLISRAGFATNVRRGPAGTDDENSQTVAFTVQAVNPAAFEIQPTIEVDGTLSFKTAANVNSLNSDLTVRVFLTDSGLNSPVPNSNRSTEKSFSITVNAINDAPIPDNFGVNSTEDLQIEIASASVLIGDSAGPTSDEAGQTLTITQVERTTALGGTVTPVFTGSVITSMIYRPAPDSVGIDTFLYVVSDNGVPSRSGTGTITVVLAGINDPPTFTKGPDQTVIEDSATVTFINWATNIQAGAPASTDEQQSQVVTFVVTANNSALFEVQPTVSSAGVLSYKPAKDAVGTSVVTLFAVDSGSNVAPNSNRSAVSTFTITLTPVNDAPVFTAGAAVSVNEDSGVYNQLWVTQIAAAGGLLSAPPTATDENAQVVDFVLTTDKPTLFAVPPAINSAGVLTFTPAQNAFGVALVSVVARDRGPAGINDQNTSAPQTLTISINAINDAPTALADNLTANENSVLNVAAPGLLANDGDVDLPADQIRTVAGNVTSSLGAAVTIAADGSVIYDPSDVVAIQKLTSGQSLTDTFVYQVRDLAGSTSSVATVTVVVSGIDDAPRAVADSYTVPVGQSLLLDVLANDTDIDTAIDPRTIVITSLPAFGTTVVNSTGVIGYTAGVGFRGIDTFSYTVRDLAGNLSNEAIVSIVVNNVPRALNDNASTTKNTPISIEVLANDVDLDGTLNRATVEIVAQPSPAGTAVVLADGKIRFTPAANFIGTATLSYVVRDDIGSPSNVAEVRIAVGSAWKNPVLDLDVNGDTKISPIDALLVINYLNSGLPTNLPASGVLPPPFLDPSGDENVTARDVLLIINYLNTHPSGEGEFESQLAAELGAPMIVTMITPEQIMATVGPRIVREIEAVLAAELEACMPWSDDESDDFAAVTGNATWQDDDLAAPLSDLVTRRDRLHRADDVDSFFESL